MTVPDERGLVTVGVEPPLAVVRLNDRARQNRLSVRTCRDLTARLRQVAAEPEVRVVVLEGLPEYFCSGVDVEWLLAGHEERVNEVWRLMRSVLDCPVPVVAGAQGHALGGGLLLALYCDVTVLSASSRYAANFLMHGFTPAAGATFLLPTVLGAALGSEMIYTGRTYRGEELAARGAGVSVVRHDTVLTATHRVALSMAQAPRRSLELVKARLVEPVRAAAERAAAGELPAHVETAQSDEVVRRIRMLAAPGAR